MKPARRGVVLFVAGRAKANHGGDLAAQEFRAAMKARSHVLRIDPPENRPWPVATLLHARRLFHYHRRLRQSGRPVVICLNHPRYLAASFWARPVLVYHGLIALRYRRATGNAAVAWLGSAALHLGALLLFLLHRQILAVGNAVTDFPRWLASSRRIVRISNMLQSGTTPPAPTPPEAPLVYLGRFVALKQVPELVRFFVAHGLGHRLMLVGDGPDLPAIRRAAEGSGVRICPPCPPAGIHHLFSQSCGFISFSGSETFCRPIFEAAFAGRPSLVPMWAGSAGWLAPLPFVTPLPADEGARLAAVRQLLDTPLAAAGAQAIATDAADFLHHEHQAFQAAVDGLFTGGA